MSCHIAKTESWKIMIWLSGHKMLYFGNTICAAQMSARPKSSNPFYEKLSIYISPRVSVYMATPWPKTVGFCDLVRVAIVPVSKNLAVTFSNMISKQVVLLLNLTLTLPIPNGTNMASCMDQQSLVMVEYTLAFLSDWTTRRFGLGLGKKSSLHYH